MGFRISFGYSTGKENQSGEFWNFKNPVIFYSLLRVRGSPYPNLGCEIIRKILKKNIYGFTPKATSIELGLDNPWRTVPCG